MDTAKLHKIIADKNDRREESVLRRAADLIESIASYQQQIATCNASILKLREELAALEVEQLSSEAILG